MTAPRRQILADRTVTSSSRVDVVLPWTGSDDRSGIARYELQRRTDGGAWTNVSTTLTKPTTTRSLATGHSYRFRVRAVDRAGNVSAWATGETFTLTRYQELNRRITYRGSWSSASSSGYLGGAMRKSSQAGAKATITFTGRSIAWVARTGPNRGKAQVFVNGTKVATVDLRSSTYKNRQVVWVRSWSSTASRTVTIRVMGTSGRPRVDLDAIITRN